MSAGCGYYNHPTKACVCSPGQVQKYLNKISGPLLDRIDIQIEIIPVPFDKISDQRRGESSASIRERVIKARQIQEKRYAGFPGTYCNAQMNSNRVAKECRNVCGLIFLVMPAFCANSFIMWKIMIRESPLPLRWLTKTKSSCPFFTSIWLRSVM